MIDTIYTDMDSGLLTGALFLDLRKAFHSVNHSVLLSKFKALKHDEPLLHWLSSYLECRTQLVDFNGKLSRSAIISTGVPQGSILGPLLFLLYVNDLPSLIDSQTVMFADDTIILSHGPSHNILTHIIQGDLDSVSSYSSRNHLVPHPSKTKVIFFSKPSQATKFEDRAILSLNSADIEYVNSYKCLGFSLEQHLDYSLHVKDICKKINYGLHIMRCVKTFVPENGLILLANSLALSHLHYCSPVLYNLSCSHIDTLLKLQKRCARLIFSCNRRTPSKPPLFIKLNWLPLHQRIELNICTLMFKILKGAAPPYLSDMFKKAAETHEHRTRNASQGCLYIQKGSPKSFRQYGARICPIHCGNV